MTCKPTVGEVRECRAWQSIEERERVVEVAAEGSWRGHYGWHSDVRCKGGSRIVEVAPEHRARVTAGPDWMGQP